MNEYNGQHVAVTGGTGFVGGALARRLLAGGAQVTVLARSPQKAAPLAALGARIVPGDLADEAAVRAAVPGADLVYHVAALMGGKLESQRVVNVDGTRRVMQAAVEAGARRVVHVSSIAVYGNVLPPVVTEETPRGFGASPYGITKAAGEDVVAEVAAHSALEAVILRPGMIFGPGSGMWTGNFFRLARLRPTPFFGNGSTPAPCIYIDDLVELLLIAGAHPAANRQTFNAVMDPPPSWREYMRALMRLAGHDEWLAVPPVAGRIAAGLMTLVAPRYSVLRDMPDMIEQVIGRTTISAGKARRLLDWQARTSPDDGAAQSAGWLREIGLL